jgi:hypothetical protein
MNPLPSPKQFLDKLARRSSSLAMLVEDVRTASRAVHLHKSFHSNPLQKTLSGAWRFEVYAGSDPTNLLEAFATVPEMEEYASPNSLRVVDQKQWQELNSDYRGPVITLLPDSNMLINSTMRKFMGTLKEHLGVDYQLLTIVNAERKKGGLRAVYGTEIPLAIQRGQESLEKRCGTMTPELHDELTVLYDIVEKYFGSEFEAMCKLIDTSHNKKPETLALNFAETRGREKQPIYVRMVEKIMEKHIAGNSVNYIADRVLAATCFAYNLVNQRNKAVVVSNDRDLISLFDLFYDEVLPRYMAKTALKAVKHRKRKKLLSMPGVEKKMVEAAREQIEWAKTVAPTFAVGTLYVPEENRFYVKEIPAPLRDYFNNVRSYRVGKSQVITGMVMTGKSAKAVVAQLMKGR